MDYLRQYINNLNQENIDLDKFFHSFSHEQKMEEILKCSVCLEAYNLSQNKPCLFNNCGHTNCLKCIQKFQDNKCPQCRQKYTKTNPNFALIDVISKFRKENKVLDPVPTIFTDLNEAQTLLTDLSLAISQGKNYMNTEAQLLAEAVLNSIASTLVKLQSLNKSTSLTFDIRKNKTCLSHTIFASLNKYKEYFGSFVSQNKIVDQYELENLNNVLNMVSEKLKIVARNDREIEASSFLIGHNRSVKCVEFNQARSLIFSASADSSIKCWSTDSSKACVQTLLGHKNVVSCLLDFETYGLVSGSWDKTIKIWSNCFI